VSIDGTALDRALRAHLEDTVAFLCDLIRIPSMRGHEGPVNRVIHDRLHAFCTRAELLQIPASFVEDPGYSWPMPGLTYADTQNLRLTILGSDPLARSLILNAHADVVPPSINQINPFVPDVKGGVVFGRGACDDKGQIAVIYLLLRTLATLGLRPRGTITCDIVIEEENGGNGTLFMTRSPVHADAAIVMEPSEGKVFAAVRGAVWFELIVEGRAGHSGMVGDAVSALKEAVKAMSVLEEYHDRLLAASRGTYPLFDVYENPMPVTFGILNAGDWPATVPASACVKGVFGFLPNTNVRTVQEGMIDAIRNSRHEYLRDHCTINFTMLNNEGNALPTDHPLVQEVVKGAAEAGYPAVISAMTAACDAWHYSMKLNIPTVVMGAGSLKYAHSNEEQIAVEDMYRMAKTLIRFLEHWCGLDAAT
jgi:acetylornithine deacetylase/succinyl-diaminopimelate desuccinylase-like protein